MYIFNKNTKTVIELSDKQFDRFFDNRNPEHYDCYESEIDLVKDLLLLSDAVLVLSDNLSIRWDIDADDSAYFNTFESSLTERQLLLELLDIVGVPTLTI